MNNNRMVSFFVNILQLFMQLCVAVTAVNMLLHGFMRYESFQVFNTLYIGIPVIVFYISRSCIKNGKAVTLIHLLATGSTLLAVQGEVEDKLLVMIPAAVLMVYSLKRTEEKPFIPLDMGVIFACYILGGTIPAESGQVIPFYAAVMYIISYTIWYNAYNMNELLISNSNVKSFNAEQAVNVNSVMLTIFMVIMAAALIIAPRLRIQNAINTVLLGIWRVVISAFKHLDIKMPQGGYELEHSLEKRIDYTGNYMPDMEMSEGNDILDMIMAVFAAVIIIGLLIMLIRSLKNVRLKISRNSDIKEFVKPRINVSEATNSKGKRSMGLFNDNETSVRKIYVHTIKKSLKSGKKINKNNAPQEITSEVLGNRGETQVLTDIYEKARYSNETLTDKEINDARNIARQTTGRR